MIFDKNIEYSEDTVKTVAKFKIYKGEDAYIAEGINFAIVTQANDLDKLVKNIEEAVSLHFEGERSKKPSISLIYELPLYA